MATQILHTDEHYELIADKLMGVYTIRRKSDGAQLPWNTGTEGEAWADRIQKSDGLLFLEGTRLFKNIPEPSLLKLAEAVRDAIESLYNISDDLEGVADMAREEVIEVIRNLKQGLK